jgi:hypothetical protein
VFTISLCTPQSEEETSLCSLLVYVLTMMSPPYSIVNTKMSPPHSVEYID